MLERRSKGPVAKVTRQLHCSWLALDVSQEDCGLFLWLAMLGLGEGETLQEDKHLHFLAWRRGNSKIEQDKEDFNVLELFLQWGDKNPGKQIGGLYIALHLVTFGE